MLLIADAITMIREIRATSPQMKTWGALLNITQLAGGLIFILTVEGPVVLATVILTLIIAGQIHKRNPFSRLTGLCHLPWLLLLPWLLHRLLTIDHSVYLKLWGWYVVIVITISLIFDAFDVVRYMQGKRTFSWANRET